MKIRNGFVSNSSSSSFVLIGCKMSDEDLVKALNVDTDNLYNTINEMGLFWDSEDEIIGYTIAKGNDYDEFDGDEISIIELMEKAKGLSESLSVPLEEIKIISGTRYS